MTCGIYLIDTHYDDWFYVGESNNVEARWKSHLRKERRQLNNHYSRFKRAHGTSLWRLKILHECELEELDLCESLVVRASLLAGMKLLNADLGGRGGKGQPKSKEHARRISEALRGRKKSPEHCVALSRGSIGKVLSEEHKKKIGEGVKSHLKTPDALTQRSKQLAIANEKRWDEYYAKRITCVDQPADAVDSSDDRSSSEEATASGTSCPVASATAATSSFGATSLVNK